MTQPGYDEDGMQKFFERNLSGWRMDFSARTAGGKHVRAGGQLDCIADRTDS